ncbi:hypothetical protein [Ureaplasma diversum]|uniref:Lipoprotein n=1 Tax=Ureaplasma diversum NCTC 246 TaxID=1188241 RepID=A0A084EVF5_9BACT|nr:hypothetical protein [Ureaplasma diversum]KEZ21947.1 Hypothetical protein, predicted lipoprotein [Ureaplasma diversum NCTC 246]
MSKFKNKKALTLAVGAIMAGVSVIGVVAACAPTKAKPAKPTEKKVEQPQTSGTESKRGSGSKQGSENNTPSTPTDKGSNNGGTTNPTGGSSKTSPEKTQPSTPEATPKNDSGTSSDNKDTNKPKEDMKQGDAPGSDSDKTNKPKVESGDGSTETNKPKEDTESKESNKQDSETGSKNGEKPNPDVNKNEPAPNSGSKDSEMKQEPGKTNTDTEGAKPGNSESDESKKMEDSMKPSETEGEVNQEVKPISVSLNKDTKITEKNGEFLLNLNFENADQKYVEVELNEIKEPASDVVVKSKAKAQITNKVVTLIFTDVNLYSKYKIKTIKVYEKQDSKDGTEIKFENLKDTNIEVDTKVLTPIAFARDKDGLPVITLETSENIYKKYIDGKKFEFEIENSKKVVGGSTHYVEDPSNLGKQIWTRQISNQNGKTRFYIYTDHKYEEEKDSGKWYISKMWESKDGSKSNLITKNINFS